jgi:hypothetical protein
MRFDLVDVLKVHFPIQFSQAVDHVTHLSRNFRRKVFYDALEEIAKYAMVILV